MGNYKERAKRLEEYIHNLFQMFQSDTYFCIFEEEDERYQNLMFALTEELNRERQKINNEVLTRKMEQVRKYGKEYIIKARSGDDSVTSNE